MGSISRWMTRCISSSRTMKLVALVSSSMSSRPAPASMLSTTLAAWEVLPLASSVTKAAVSLPLGRSWMNREMSVRRMLRPSSARIFDGAAVGEDILPPVPQDVGVDAPLQRLEQGGLAVIARHRR